MAVSCGSEVAGYTGHVEELDAILPMFFDGSECSSTVDGSGAIAMLSEWTYDFSKSLHCASTWTC